MSETTSVANGLRDRISDIVTRSAMHHLDVVSRAPLYASALEALIETNMVLAGQRRIQMRVLSSLSGQITMDERRVAREQADRMSLDPQRASMPHRPSVWWHEGGSGPTLVLLNGWTASGLMWPRRFVTRLEESYRVIRIDNRGTGYSRTALAPYTMRTMADDVADVLRVSGGAPALVVGLSMGGMITQELAIRHPELVRQMVLVGTRPPGPSHIAAAASVLQRAVATPQHGDRIEEFVAAVWTAFCGPRFRSEHPEDLVAELVEQSLRRVTPKAAVGTQLRAIAAWHGSPRLRTITCPTVVVHGDADRLMPVGNGMRLAHLIPQARYVELPDVGHIVPMEAGDELAAIMEGLG